MQFKKPDVAPEDIVGRQCVLARYAEAVDKSKDDLVLIKEKIHAKDGSVHNNIHWVKNYKRDFYITKPGCRDHEQKKEWEELSKVNRYETTQARLADDIAKVLRKGQGNDLRRICQSPYVYGADITTTSLIKNSYAQKWPGCQAPLDVAILDYETDVLNGTKEIISGSLTFKGRAILAVTRDFLGDVPTPEATFQRLFKARETYSDKIWKHLEKRNVNCDFIICENPKEVVTTLMDKAHEWNPDIVGIWNIAFDMEKMLEILAKYGVLPEDVFCHPDVPTKYRKFKWIKKKAAKVTGEGKKINKHPAELWHTAHHLAGFYFVDMMSLFCLLRVAAGKRPSYALDAILDTELGLGKLRFDFAEDFTGLEWHVEMQRFHKIEYLIYNVFDCISVELLDEKVRDAQQVLPTLAGISKFSKFDSNPKRLADDLHFYCLDNKRVIGTTGQDMEHPDDKYVLNMKDWIVTLSPFLRAPESSLRIVEEDPDLITEAYAHVSDLDVRSSYPTTEVVLNTSKETTRRELCKLAGRSEKIQRRAGLNMTGARTNAVEICNDIFKLPFLHDMLDEYKRDRETMGHFTAGGTVKETIQE